MIKDLDLHNPDFSISLTHLSHSSTIYSIMRDQGIVRAYVYGMVFRPKILMYDFLKIGMSAPKLGEKREYQVGERIVRQVSWLPGWQDHAPYSSHGSEFWHNVNRKLIQEQKVLPSQFNKNYITVAIWDVSKRINQSNIVSSDEELSLAKWAEGELTNQYKNYYNGNTPPLNIVDPAKSKIYKGGFIRKDVLNEFIQFD